MRAETTNIRDLNGFNATPPPAINVSVINPISSDFEGPVMSAFALYPPTIDLTNGAVTVSATVRITDQTGVATPSSNFGGAYITGTPSGNIYFSHWVRVSGDQFDGIYECFKTIEPDQIPEGDYTLRAETTNIRDLNGFNATPPPAINVSVINTPQGCEFAIVNNPFDQSLDFCLGEAITPFEFRLESNCNSSSLSIDVYGLPEGIDYLTSSTDSFTILTFQGTPTTAGTNFVNVNITSNNAYTSVSGIVFIDGNCNGTGSGTGTNTTGQTDADLDGVPDQFDECPDTPFGQQVDSLGCPYVQEDCALNVEGNLDRTICIDEEIEPIRLALDSSCTSSSIDASIIGLPPGLSYLMQNAEDGNEFIIQGTAFIPGDYQVTVFFYDLNNFIEQTINGRIFVESDCSTNTTGSQNDRDQDGINDDIDVCPNTQQGVAVDENGCAISEGIVPLPSMRQIVLKKRSFVYQHTHGAYHLYHRYKLQQYKY